MTVITLTLIARLYAKIDKRGPDDCWPWTGALSRGKGRESVYGSIIEGGRRGKVWRVPRLMLCLTEIAPDTTGVELIQLLRLVNRLHEFEDASHQCDVSICCNPAHLKWEPHTDNVKGQVQRRRASRMAKATLESSHRVSA